ncbi:MAG: PRD domain-containing protein, partial [Dorea sp.]
MYRIKKVLNHNTVIAISQDDNQECLIMGKGIGFGKKTSERIDTRPEDRVYSMKEYTERGSAKEIIKSVPPEFLEITNEVLNEAEKIFGKIDRNVLFPLADHIAFAVQRIQNYEQISNPLTEDIRVLFHMEFKAAEKIRPLLEHRMGIQIDDDEVGYVALHIHSAIEDEKVSQAMQMARAVRECISLVEQTVGKQIDVASLSYNRLMNHIRYMVARAMSGEKLKVNMNDYMKIKFPEAFQMAESVCAQVGHSLGCKLEDV